MDWLRISLLAVGVVLLLGIWGWHRFRVQQRQRALREESDDWAESDVVHIRAQRDDDLGPPAARAERRPAESPDAMAAEEPAPVTLADLVRGGAVEPGVARVAADPAEAPDSLGHAPDAGSGWGGSGETADVSAPRVVGRNSGGFRNRREKILLLHVVAPRNRPFPGVALGASLRRAGLQLGEMSIYHAPAAPEGIDPLFSVANMVAPGTLSENDLADLTTPGITLFMQLHQIETPREAFDAMLAAAHALAQDLGGSVLDSNRSTATNQTLAYMREEMHQWLLRYRPDLLRRRSGA